MYRIIEEGLENIDSMVLLKGGLHSENCNRQ